MLKKILIMTLALLLAFSLVACESAPSSDTDDPVENDQKDPTEDKDPIEEKEPVEGTLYGNFSTGSTYQDKEDYQKTKTEMFDEITVESLSEALTEWTGLQFIYNDVTMEGDTITIDWDGESTFVTGDAPIPQKDEFHFFDAFSLRWFMLDSLHDTLMANLDVTAIYYTMEGETISIVDFTMPAGLSFEGPYQGSPYYFQAEGAGGEFGQIVGTWSIDGDTSSAYIMFDEDGTYRAFYASGISEYFGYLEPVDGEGSFATYEAYDIDGVFVDTFVFEDAATFTSQNTDHNYKKIDG